MATLWEKDGVLIENDAGTALLECDDCPCDVFVCDGCIESPPLQLQVTFSGITPGGAVPCSDCSPLNDTFVLDAIQDGACIWQYILDPPICQLDRIVADLGIFVGTNTLRVQFVDNESANNELVFLLDLGENPADCEFDGTGLNHAQNPTSGFCHGNTATCTVTAL